MCQYEFWFDTYIVESSCFNVFRTASQRLLKSTGLWFYPQCTRISILKGQGLQHAPVFLDNIDLGRKFLGNRGNWRLYCILQLWCNLFFYWFSREKKKERKRVSWKNRDGIFIIQKFVANIPSRHKHQISNPISSFDFLLYSERALTRSTTCGRVSSQNFLLILKEN